MMENVNVDNNCSLLKNNKITKLSKNVYLCNICNCAVYNLDVVKEHIAGYFHTYLLNKKDDKDQQLDEQLYSNESLMNFNVPEIKTPFQYYTAHLKGFNSTSEMTSTSNSPLSPDMKLNCNCCQVNFDNRNNYQQHLKSKSHIKKLRKLRKQLWKEKFGQPVQDNEGKSKVEVTFCELCNVDCCTNDNYNDHINGKRHNSVVSQKEELKKLESKKTFQQDVQNDHEVQITSKFEVCELCDVKILSHKYSVIHMKSLRHISKKKELMKSMNKENMQSSVENDNNVQKKSPTKEIICDICNVKVTTEYNFIQHMKGKRHSENEKEFNLNTEKNIQQSVQNYMEIKKNASSMQIICKLCNVNIPSEAHFYQHVIGYAHTRKEERLQDEMDKDNTTTKENENHCNNFPTSSSISEASSYTSSIRSSSSGSQSSDSVNGKHSSSINTSKNSITSASSIVLLQEERNQSQNSNKKNKKIKKKVNNEEKSSNFNGFNVNSSNQILSYYIKLFLNPGNENVLEKVAKQMFNHVDKIEFTCVRNEEIICLICLAKFTCDSQLLYDHIRDAEHERTYEQLKDLNKLFEDYPGKEQWSDYKLGRELMKEVSDNNIMCIACETTVTNEEEEISLHVASTNHLIARNNLRIATINKARQIFISAEDNWYYIEKYWCEVCNEKFCIEINFAEHLMSQKHLQRCQEDSSYCYDTCITCSTMWFGQEGIYREHLKTQEHKYHFWNKTYKVGEMPLEVRKIMNNFKEYMEILSKCLNKEQFLRLTESLVVDLEKSLQNTFPLIKANVFGSRFNNVYLPNADIDISLDTGSSKVSSTSNEQENTSNIQSKVIKNILDTLNESDFFETLKIAKDKQSAIFFSKIHAVKYNITFDDNINIKKSNILRYFINANDVIKSMILFLKNWLILCNFDRQHIGSYAISWLVIFYFQSIRALPGVHEFISNKQVISSAFRKNVSLKSYLASFFEYYSKFDYKRLVICPFLGQAIKKEVFVDLPEELKGRSSKNVISKSILEYICVLQDPVNVLQNITENVTKQCLRKFQYFCAESEKHFRSSLNK